MSRRIREKDTREAPSPGTPKPPAPGSDSSGQTITLQRDILVQKMEECYNKASPYSGEYNMGIADFINTILGNPPIHWDSHPRWRVTHNYDSSSTTKKEEGKE